jgi:hypothetical protein
MIDLTGATECSHGTRTVQVAQIEDTREVQPFSVPLPNGPIVRIVTVELKPYRKGNRVIFYGEHQGKRFVAYS